MEGQTASAERSRDSVAGAGWECESGALPGRRSIPFTWLNPLPLWRSRNDRLARLLGDPTNDRRRAWMRQLGHGELPELILERPSRGGSTAFLLMGDTGEGDESQQAVARALRGRAEGTDFMFICSDVIYPAGGIEEYPSKFFEPYESYPNPIFAIPGNHDWYDDCTGFMRCFCGAEGAPAEEGVGFSPREWLRRVLWRRPRHTSSPQAEALAARRPATGQPASYFAIDTGPLLLVCIDTGITGEIDADQAAWLKLISATEQPKILLTGKPIYVDGTHRPGRIEGSDETVDGIVTTADNHYIAAIGGDIHNYQRYPIDLKDGRRILYLVSGGGGAFMHATHTLPNIDQTEIAARVREEDFRCYPLRGDSLSLYSKLYSAKLLGRLRGARPIPPDEAAAIVGERLGIEPTRRSAREASISSGAIRSADALMGLPGRGRGSLHIPFSEWLDWNEPPLFKSFLRIDAAAGDVRIRCFAATGCADQETDPPLEDDLRWTAAGSWELPA